MLILPIKKKWFDMIKSGEKKEEYREIKPYYNKRLPRYFGQYLSEWGELVPFSDRTINGVPLYNWVIFRNGYSKKSPQIKCFCSLDKGIGKEEWGADPDERYYILKIDRVEELN